MLVVIVIQVIGRMIGQVDTLDRRVDSIPFPLDSELRYGCGDETC